MLLWYIINISRHSELEPVSLRQTVMILYRFVSQCSVLLYSIAKYRCFFVETLLIAAKLQEIIICEQVPDHLQACVLTLDKISVPFIVIRNMISWMYDL
jgi:hypothetical protein